MKKHAKIALFVHHPQCSISSAHGVIRSLYNEFDIECIDQSQLRESVLKHYDVVAIPGGIGDSDTWHNILEPYQDAIQDHVSRGRGYLGICMGAYWAGSYYLNLLDGIEPVQYIKRPGADVKRSFGTVVSCDWLGHPETMYFYDGCAFQDQGGDYEVIARYANQDPAAIIQNNIGVMGPHPESDIYWFSKKFMQPHWHHYRHHELLLNFVKRICTGTREA